MQVAPPPETPPAVASGRPGFPAPAWRPCGTLGRKAVLTSTSSFGPPDLDLRPQGPARWALEFEVQRCDSCGYCAGSIGQAPPDARAVVESLVYREVLQRSKLPKLARSFFCAALVAESAGEAETSAWWFLQAAWACDDRNARAQARICRERAAEMFVRALETGETERPAPVMHMTVRACSGQPRRLLCRCQR